MRGLQLNSMLVPRGAHILFMWGPCGSHINSMWPTWALHEQCTSPPCVNSAPAPRGATTHELAPILGALVEYINYNERV